ncbi:hypothetical protein ABIC63_000536 [Pseudacidovorax sp. 1753]|uniref:hypothetical protein n=1 Tax=Pseudacidovorax sp. 1753 TaxID=3156419 RepID=UPI003398F68B
MLDRMKNWALALVIVAAFCWASSMEPEPDDLVQQDLQDAIAQAQLAAANDAKGLPPR